MLEAGVASLLQVEEFFDNATFAPSLVHMGSVPAGGPHGIGVVVPEDDQVLGAAFALRRQASDEAFEELWRPGAVRWSFMAHPDVPVSLFRFALNAEARPAAAGPWRPIERAFLAPDSQRRHQPQSSGRVRREPGHRGYARSRSWGVSVLKAVGDLPSFERREPCVGSGPPRT